MGVPKIGRTKDRADLRELLETSPGQKWREEVSQRLGKLPPRCQELWIGLLGSL